mmetsp:Transcript_20190/g.47785  ORF Transcript_20190/g.47785 Transcript_20190/m.47785 type:complete len:274 (+) Transcript_20190:672-1493(+)
MCHDRLFLDAGVYSQRRRRALLRAAFLVLAVPSAICAPQRSRDLLHWHQPVRGSAGVASANGKFQRSACSVFLLLQRSQASADRRSPALRPRAYLRHAQEVVRGAGRRGHGASRSVRLPGAGKLGSHGATRNGPQLDTVELHRVHGRCGLGARPLSNHSLLESRAARGAGGLRSGGMGIARVHEMGFLGFGEHLLGSVEYAFPPLWPSLVEVPHALWLRHGLVATGDVWRLPGVHLFHGMHRVHGPQQPDSGYRLRGMVYLDCLPQLLLERAA